MKIAFRLGCVHMHSFVWTSAPLRSILVSLISRCAQIKQKSTMLHAGSVRPVLECTLGVVAPHEELTRFLRHLLLSIFRHMCLRAMTVVWIDAPLSFEPIATERVKIVKSAPESPIVCVVDLGCLARCDSVAAMQHCMGNWIRAGTTVPVITLTPRWERILAWVDAAKRNKLPTKRGVHVEPLGHLSVVSFRDDEGPLALPSLRVPTVAAALMETWAEPGEVVQKGSIISGDATESACFTVPAQMLVLAANQGRFYKVFDTPLDTVAARMASRRVLPPSQPHTPAEQKAAGDLVTMWNRQLDFLGCMQLTVWIYDVERRAHGIVAAALDAWTTGSTSWPI